MSPTIVEVFRMLDQKIPFIHIVAVLIAVLRGVSPNCVDHNTRLIHIPWYLFVEALRSSPPSVAPVASYDDAEKRATQWLRLFIILTNPGQATPSVRVLHTTGFDSVVTIPFSAFGVVMCMIHQLDPHGRVDSIVHSLELGGALHTLTGDSMIPTTARHDLSLVKAEVESILASPTPTVPAVPVIATARQVKAEVESPTPTVSVITSPVMSHSASSSRPPLPPLPQLDPLEINTLLQLLNHVDINTM